jgi:hypothetical protein
MYFSKHQIHRSNDRNHTTEEKKNNKGQIKQTGENEKKRASSER